jgi:hypothetical protein
LGAYSIALYLHLISLLVATVAASLATYAALQLRASTGVEEALRWIRLTGRVVPAFPLASIGLFATGAYMTAALWTWLTPWIDASVAGLVLIVLLGSGVEAQRGRALRAELEHAGFSERARSLIRDPLAWSAKGATLALALAVVFDMTVKPAAVASVAAIVAGFVVGVVVMTPLWRGRPAELDRQIHS